MLRCVGLLLVSLAAGTLGCLGPRQFPAKPLSVTPTADGGSKRAYDTNLDGKADTVEILDREGRVIAVRYDRNRDGEFEIERAWKDRSSTRGDQPVRQLLIVLDSIPVNVVEEMYAQGHFPYFHRPTRVLSPFPVMTDPCLAEFFDLSPVPGVEAAYYNGQYLTNSSDTYMAGGNAPWMSCTSFKLPMVDHAWSYMYPNVMYNYALGQLQVHFERSNPKEDFLGYIVGTSAVGSKHGCEGHAAALRQLDRLCQQFIADAGGELEITLMSDHGHTCGSGWRLILGPHLAAAGYRISLAVRDEKDVVVPEWGLVSCAALYCKPQTAARLAKDVVSAKGVEHAAYRSGDDEVTVFSKTGEARIVHSQDRFAYLPETGDPLQLSAVVEQLRRRGLMDGNGFAHADAWFEATVDGPFPDAPARLYRAFNGLFQNVPQVLLSLEDGVYHGSGALALLLNMAAVHGSLRPESSYGFAMSTVAELPATVRMQDLRRLMNEAGIRARCMK